MDSSYRLYALLAAHLGPGLPSGCCCAIGHGAARGRIGGGGVLVLLGTVWPERNSKVVRGAVRPAGLCGKDGG